MSINSIDQLIKSVLCNEGIYVSHECKHLLSSGENYGSLMLDVKIKIERNGKEETICCVAKTTPQSELMWKIFNTPATFKKEISVYQEIVPTLNEFGKEKGIDNLLPSFAKCIGARVSLDPTSTVVDKDAVLLLENLKIRGFTTADRFVGFNAAETEIILKDLATFHAAPIALKLQKPKEFDKKIRPHLNKDFSYGPDEHIFNKFMGPIKAKVSTNEKLSLLYPKIEEACRKSLKLIQQYKEPNQLYGTMVHNDYWVNNTMLRYENGTPIENIFVDFQVMEYNSLSTDLAFFLYTSVQVEVLQDNMDYFINYYFDHFINTLERLGCNTEKYTQENFLEDMKCTVTNYQLWHILMMLLPIYTKKDKATDLSNVQHEDDVLFDEASMHDNYVKRLGFILLDFEKRGWI